MVTLGHFRWGYCLNPWFQANLHGVQRTYLCQYRAFMPITNPLLKMLSFRRRTHEDLINQVNSLTIENQTLRSIVSWWLTRTFLECIAVPIFPLLKIRGWSNDALG